MLFRSGGFLAVWVIGYGIVQTLAPKITGNQQHQGLAVGVAPDSRSALIWASLLAFVPALIASAIQFSFYPEASLLLGLMLFGALFAVNSSLHSYLIVSYASEEAVSLDVGFYYMANAMGRLVGTVLSGLVYQAYGLAACLWISTAFIGITAMISIKLPRQAVE